MLSNIPGFFLMNLAVLTKKSCVVILYLKLKENDIVKNKFYTGFCVFFLLILTCIVCYGDEESVVALPGHELGDQVFSLRAGVLVPLFFHDFEAFQTYPHKSSVGAVGGVQWNFYVSSYLRMGADISLGFSLDPNNKLYNMIPVTFKVSYVTSVSRFEFPFSFSTGVAFLNYQDIFKVSFIARPGVAGFWRYDANLSFGMEIAYLWIVEFPAGDNPAIAGNYLSISPSLFYHF